MQTRIRYKMQRKHPLEPHWSVQTTQNLRFREFIDFCSRYKRTVYCPSYFDQSSSTVQCDLKLKKDNRPAITQTKLPLTINIQNHQSNT